jgi:hypothetical protein
VDHLNFGIALAKLVRLQARTYAVQKGNPMSHLFLLQASPGTIQTVWWLSIVIALVVAVVVAVLLEMVRRTALQIRAGASAIWTNGKLVANDTIQIPIFLKTTNRVAGEILVTAQQIVGATEAIKQHANGCPGCPACVLDPNLDKPEPKS